MELTTELQNILSKTPMKLKGEIDKPTIIVGDFKTPHSVTDRISTQKISKAIEDLNNSINQLDRPDIYRTLYPITVEYTLFSSGHGTFTEINYILGHKFPLKNFLNIQLTLK